MRRYRRNTREALAWIVSILQRHDVEFQVTGGFAASLYGSKKEVRDIDIAVSYSGFNAILADVKPYIIFGPGQYIDPHFNVRMVTLRFRKQEIDVGTQCKIYDRHKKRWRSIAGVLGSSNWRTVFGLRIPLVRKTDLLFIKDALGRPTDRKDLVGLLDPKS